MNIDRQISAINEVLEAEKSNQERIADCQKQAEQIIEQGRLQARSIIKRGDERIASVHARADLAIEGRVAELKQKMASLSSHTEISDSDRQQLQFAVSLLTNELVGMAE
jgi:regulator of protease activity HflC (stomatin/prohibitin superfamily)